MCVHVWGGMFFRMEVNGSSLQMFPLAAASLVYNNYCLETLQSLSRTSSERAVLICLQTTIAQKHFSPLAELVRTGSSHLLTNNYCLETLQPRSRTSSERAVLICLQTCVHSDKSMTTPCNVWAARVLREPWWVGLGHHCQWVLLSISDQSRPGIPVLIPLPIHTHMHSTCTNSSFFCLACTYNQSISEQMSCFAVVRRPSVTGLQQIFSRKVLSVSFR